MIMLRLNMATFYTTERHINLYQFDAYIFSKKPHGGRQLRNSRPTLGAN